MTVSSNAFNVYDTNTNGTGVMTLDSTTDLSQYNLSCESLAIHISGNYSAVVC
jgi:hypothetical protein